MMTQFAPADAERSATQPPTSVLYRELIQLRREVRMLRQECYTLSSQVALFWHPAREKWERHTAPDVEDFQSPTLLLPVAPEARIDRVTIDQYQFIRSYDAKGEKIDRWTGYFNKIGVPLLAKTKSKEWKLIHSELPPPVLPETPIPMFDASRA